MSHLSKTCILCSLAALLTGASARVDHIQVFLTGTVPEKVFARSVAAQD